MERSYIKNSLIISLEEKIKAGNNRALQEFWSDIQKGNTPLIETIEGDLENSLVTFIYRGDKDTKNIVFIPPVNSEKIVDNQMERLLDTDLWYISYKIKNNLRFVYYFSVNDSLEIEDEKRWHNVKDDKFNENRNVFEDTDGSKDVMSFVEMPNAEEKFWSKKREESHKGILHDHRFYSENLGDNRRVRVYTPYEYNENGKNYKFIMLTDGDEYINGMDIVNVLDNLIEDKKIPPIVAIFIDSTEKRDNELTCSDKFLDVIVKELLPWVKGMYSISNMAEDAIIGGLSYGGLTATYMGLKHSEVFGNVLSESGSYWYKPENYEGYEPDCWIRTEFIKRDKLPLKFYMNVGIIENPEGMIGTNIILKDVLIEKGYDVKFEYFNSGHDYLCWGEKLADGLIYLIGLK